MQFALGRAEPRAFIGYPRCTTTTDIEQIRSLMDVAMAMILTHAEQIRRLRGDALSDLLTGHQHRGTAF